MSTVMVVTPVLIANWSALSTAVGAAVGTMGFTSARAGHALACAGGAINREVIEVADSELLEAARGTTDEIVVERDQVRATLSRNPRGTLRVCMESQRLTKEELRTMGAELIGRITQQYAYHRIVSALAEHNMAIVDEQLTDDGSVRIRVRNY